MTCQLSPSTPLDQCYAHELGNTHIAYPLIDYARKQLQERNERGPVETVFPLAGTLTASVAMIVLMYRTSNYLSFRSNVAMQLRLKNVDMPLNGRRRPTNPTTSLFSFLFVCFRLIVFILTLCPAGSLPSFFIKSYAMLDPTNGGGALYSTNGNGFLPYPGYTVYSAAKDATYFIRIVSAQYPGLFSAPCAANATPCSYFGRFLNLTAGNASAALAINITPADANGDYQLNFGSGSFFSVSDLATNAWQTAAISALVALCLHAVIEAALLLWWRRAPMADQVRWREQLRGVAGGGVLNLLDFIEVQTSPPGRPVVLFDCCSRISCILSIGLITVEGFAAALVMFLFYQAYFSHWQWTLVICITSYEYLRFMVRLVAPMPAESATEPARYDDFDRYLDFLDEERRCDMSQKEKRPTSSSSSFAATPGPAAAAVELQSFPETTEEDGDSGNETLWDPRRNKISRLEHLHLDVSSRPLWEVLVSLLIPVVGITAAIGMFQWAPSDKISPAVGFGVFTFSTMLPQLFFFRNDLALVVGGGDGEDGGTTLSLVVRRRNALGATFQVDITPSVIREEVELDFSPSGRAEGELVVDSRRVYSMPLANRGAGNAGALSEAEQQRHKAILQRLIRTVRDSRRDIYKLRQSNYYRNNDQQEQQEQQQNEQIDEGQSHADHDDYYDDERHDSAIGSCSSVARRARTKSQLRRGRIERQRPDNAALAAVALVAGRLCRSGKNARDLLHASAELNTAQSNDLPQALLSASAELPDFLFLPSNPSSRRALLYCVLLALRASFALALDLAPYAPPVPFCAPQLESLSRCLEILLIVTLFNMRKMNGEHSILEPNLFSLLQRAVGVISLFSTTLQFSTTINVSDSRGGFGIAVFVFGVMTTFMFLMMPITQ